MELKVVLEPEEKGGFKAYVPSLLGCSSQGMNEDDALKNIRDAILMYFGIEEVVSASH
ncbi:MAG: type II toxin-antitoxin system HicB family antitoxin [bacterium]